MSTESGSRAGWRTSAAGRLRSGTGWSGAGKVLFLALVLQGSALMAGDVPDFELSCDSSVVEGATASCTVRNVAEEPRPWPGVVVFHRSDDSRRALVRGRVDVKFGSLSPAVEAEGALWWVGETLIGYSRIDWGGQAAAGGVRTVPIRAVDDDRFEGTEAFYVTLIPDGSRNETALYYDTSAQRVSIVDDDARSSVTSLSRIEIGLVDGTTLLAGSGDVEVLSVEVPYEQTELVVSADASHGGATVTVDGVALEKGGTSQAIRVPVGYSSVSVSVLAEDGTTRRTYWVTVTRAAEPAGGTVSVEADGFTLECPSRVYEGETAACTLSHDEPSARAFPVVALLHSSMDRNRAILGEDSLIPSTNTAYRQDVQLAASEREGAQFEYGYGELFSGGSRSWIVVYGFEKFDGPGDLAVNGTATVSFAVHADDVSEVEEVFYVALAPDGYTGLSELVANKAPIVVKDPRATLAADAALSALTLSGIDIGAFTPEVTAYTISVAHGVSNTTVTATASHTGAVVSTVPPDADADAPGHQVSLSEGANEIRVSVTAEDEETARTYTVTVTRAALPVATIAAGTGPVTEGGSATFTVTLSQVAASTLDVAVSTTESGSMLSGAPPALVRFGVGEQSATLWVPTVGDTVVEADSTVTVAVTAGDGYVLGSSPSASVTVADDDEASFSVSAAPAEIEEGQSAALTVAITNGVTFPEEQALALQVSGVSASDYSLAPEMLALTAGSSSAVLSAALDDLEEAAETAQIEVLLNGSVVGSASVVISDPVLPPVPGIAGVPQVGGVLEAVFEEPAPADLRYQWLRGAGGEEISGAVGASYTAVEADEDEAVSVRVDLGNAAVAHTSAATAPVWPAASNPPLHGRDEELLGATMTLGSSDAFPLWLAGYGRFEGVAFGSMDRLSFSVGDVEHELTVAMVNALGGFALQASPRIADVSGLVVYWNDYRIESLAPDNGSDPQFWVASTPQPKSEYGRYWRGASDGVQVALSIRRPGPEDDASLSGLTLSDVDIGAFDSEVTSYTAEVAFDVEMTTLEAVASDDRAVVEIADSVGSTVGPRRTSRLAGGANEITVTVTAADQETTRTYAVTVTRLPPPWGARHRSRDISLSGASTATGVWSDGSTMWVVADRWEGLVQGYSLADGSRLAERDLELVGGYGYTTALWSDGSTLWAADYYGGVLAYRLSDGARLTEKDLDGAVLSAAGNDNPGGLWSDGTTLWVADHIDGWVYAYLLSDGSRVSAEEFSVRTSHHHGMNPFGLWFGDGTVLASYWARGLVMAYRESDGSHLGSREIDTGSSGNDFPRGLWSDGSTLWVADEVDLKLYAYAVPVSVAASQVSVESGPFGPIPPSWAPAVPSASPGPPVFIPDAGLRSRLEAALGKAPGESIGTREMAAIETLNLDGSAPDLWALTGLAGLKRLSLRGNDLEDLSALSLLTNLEVLDIGENRIVDLGPLAALTGLESLRADGNAIRDLTPLAGLTSLRHLSLSDNAITDPLPLAGLTALVTLDLWANRVEDLLPRQGLPQVDGGRTESPEDGQDAVSCGVPGC